MPTSPVTNSSVIVSLAIAAAGQGRDLHGAAAGDPKILQITDHQLIAVVTVPPGIGPVLIACAVVVGGAEIVLALLQHDGIAGPEG